MGLKCTNFTCFAETYNSNSERWLKFTHRRRKEGKKTATDEINQPVLIAGRHIPTFGHVMFYPAAPGLNQMVMFRERLVTLGVKRDVNSGRVCDPPKVIPVHPVAAEIF